MSDKNDESRLPEKTQPNTKSNKFEILQMLKKMLENNETIQENTEKSHDVYSIFQQILRFGNSLFVKFFNPLEYLFGENDESVKMLTTEPFFKKAVWMILLTIFAYISYYIFGRLNTGKTNYIESSIWLWIMMFTILITFIRVKPPMEKPITSN